MVGTSPLRGLLDRARNVFKLAGQLGLAFSREAKSPVVFFDLTIWNNHAPVFNEFCEAILGLRDAIQNPPDVFEIVAQELREAGRIAKAIQDAFAREGHRTFTEFRECYPALNSVCHKGMRAVDEVVKGLRLDDRFAFLDEPPKVESSGGNVVIRAGNGGPNGNGGAVNIQGGDGGPGGRGGTIEIRGGDASGRLQPDPDGTGQPTIGPSLADLIGRAIRRLKANPDLLRSSTWDHSETLNVGGINAAAKAIGLGPIFAIGEAAPWWTWPNLPEDHPKNQHKVECLTVYHPDGTEYRIRRNSQPAMELDDSSNLPLAETIASLEAWGDKAAESSRPIRSVDKTTDLIDRLLDGPDDAELTLRESALLEAYLSQPISLSTIQQERRANPTGESELCNRRNKLKLIRDFNRNLQVVIGIAADAQKPTSQHSAKPNGTKTGEAGEPASNAPNPPKQKRSTQRGDAREKLIAALTKHHKYAEGSCLNQEPIGCNALAKQVGVSKSSASKFFDDNFKPKDRRLGGHAAYRVVCRDVGRLVNSLKAIRGEFSPNDLYGRRPADEDDRDADE